MAKASKKGATKKTVLIGPEEASSLIKKYAAKQRIEVNLSEEQYSQILGEWNDKNPRLPAEITFLVKDKPKINLKVAGYRYRGNTCCV